MFAKYCTLATLILLAVSANAGSLKDRYVGKSDCIPELKSAREYGIRLDESQHAYLFAYDVKDAHVLAIVQYQSEGAKCGVIRDIVESDRPEPSFIWECVDTKIPSDVVVGTRPSNHPSTTGPALEAWKVDLITLKFAPLQRKVTCNAGNYAGTDQGDSLADWARKRTKNTHPKR